jgi:hypothetical protein
MVLEQKLWITFAGSALSGALANGEIPEPAKTAAAEADIMLDEYCARYGTIAQQKLAAEPELPRTHAAPPNSNCSNCGQPLTQLNVHEYEPRQRFVKGCCPFCGHYFKNLDRQKVIREAA